MRLDTNFGHQKWPKLVSNRINLQAVQITGGYELDLTSLQLK